MAAQKIPCKYPHCTNFYPSAENKTFYQFPEEEHVCNRWKEVCKLHARVKVGSYFVCEDHFLETDFVAQSSGDILLDPSAVPKGVKIEELCLEPNSDCRSDHFYGRQDITSTIPKVELELECEEDISKVEEKADLVGAILIKDVLNVCRTCLGESLLLPIHKTKVEEIAVTDILGLCTSIKVEPNDPLPSRICVKCVQTLSQMDKFRKQCLQNDAILKAIFEQAQVPPSADSNLVENVPPEPKAIDPLVVQDRDDRQEIVQDRDDQQEIVTPPPFKCSRCSASFENLSELNQHRKVHIQQVLCNFCGMLLTKKSAHRHMAIHRDDSVHQCDICHLRCSTGANLARHKRSVHGGHEERLFMCEICARSFKNLSSLNYHTSTHSDERKFICPCGKTFKNDMSLRQHNRTHVAERNGQQFPCGMCDKVFRLKGLWRSHQRTHTGERPYVCNCCSKRFSQSSGLSSHRLTHLGRKDHTCRYCPRTFRQRGHLHTHEKTHTGERPYKCDFCKAAFALNGNLTVHMRIHTGETPYVCDVCGKGHRDASQLKRHKQRHLL